MGFFIFSSGLGLSKGKLELELICISMFCLLLCVVLSQEQNFKVREPNKKLKDDDNCETLLESFALATANFTFCTIRFARPIRLCEFCVEKYLIVESVHNDILTLEDEEGEQCKAKLINLDRLQVVEAGFDYVTGLWNRANCNKCFKVNEHLSPTKELNDNTKDILKISNDTQICIENHRNDSSSSAVESDPKVCSECKSLYLELNSRYETLKEGGFCMDIVDMMNLTRAQWSNDLGCCLDRKQPEWFFLVSSCIFAFLPLTFYLAAFLFTTRKEQIVLKQRRLQERHNSAMASDVNER